MTSSHLWHQNTNQASSRFSKLWWCRRCPYEALSLYLITRIQYIGF